MLTISAELLFEETKIKRLSLAVKQESSLSGLQNKENLYVSK